MSPCTNISKDLALFGFLPFSFLPQQCTFLQNWWSQVIFGPYSAVDSDISGEGGVKCSIRLFSGYAELPFKGLGPQHGELGVPFLKT